MHLMMQFFQLQPIFRQVVRQLPFVSLELELGCVKARPEIRQVAVKTLPYDICDRDKKLAPLSEVRAFIARGPRPAEPEHSDCGCSRRLEGRLKTHLQ